MDAPARHYPRQSQTTKGRLLGEEVGRFALTIQPSLLSQKADLAVGVAPDEADNHGLLLAALEAVDAPELNAWEGLL
jgi:hypothetical protein